MAKIEVTLKVSDDGTMVAKNITDGTGYPARPATSDIGKVVEVDAPSNDWDTRKRIAQSMGNGQ